MDISCNFSVLPDELKLRIFSYLPQEELRTSVAKTCTEWEKLAFDAHLWKDISFNKSHDENYITEFLTRSYLAERVTFSNKRFFLRLFSYPGCTLPSVSELSFQSCHFNVSDFDRLTEIFPNVEKIMFKNSSICYICTTEINQWHLLKKVTLCDMIGEQLDNFVLLISKLCKNLELFICNDCDCVIDSTLLKFFNRFQHSLAILRILFSNTASDSYKALGQCSNLRVLTISNAWSMTDQDFCILGGLKALQTLAINYNDQLFSHQFPNLFNHVQFQQLTGLSLNGCSNFNDTALKVIINCCPVLAKIGLFKIFNITSEIASSLCDCKNLRELVLFCVPNVTDVTKIKLLLPRTFENTISNGMVITRYCV